MTYSIQYKAARLEFTESNLIHANLSGAAFSGKWLWVAGDEACGVDRLQHLPSSGSEQLRFGQAVHFPLTNLLDLPGNPEDEADLEGMAIEDGWLWVVGSHGLKRKNAKPDRSHADNAKRLTKLALDTNRRLLARLPLQEGADGQPEVMRSTPDGRKASRLRGDAEDNELTRLLADDPHFAPFLKIPGKDNGFDIEGLALLGNRLMLGLRGPVLRGWACLLEIAITEKENELRLAALDDSGCKLRKHFLPLDGLGIRDLHFEGDMLQILAGPTMVLDGDVRVFGWQDAKPQLLENTENIVFWPKPNLLCALPHSPGRNRAEAFCALPAELSPTRQWLALYDAPDADRLEGPLTVFGDIVSES